MLLTSFKEITHAEGSKHPCESHNGPLEMLHANLQLLDRKSTRFYPHARLISIAYTGQNDG